MRPRSPRKLHYPRGVQAQFTTIVVDLSIPVRPCLAWVLNHTFSRRYQVSGSKWGTRCTNHRHAALTAQSIDSLANPFELLVWRQMARERHYPGARVEASIAHIGAVVAPDRAGERNTGRINTWGTVPNGQHRGLNLPGLALCRVAHTEDE